MKTLAPTRASGPFAPNPLTRAAKRRHPAVTHYAAVRPVEPAIRYMCKF